MIDDTLLVALIAAAFLSIFVYFLYQYTLRRRSRILASEVEVPAEDRAFNLIRLGRSGAAHLAGQGYDVRSVTDSLDSAERRYAKRDHSGALRYAEEAREKLRLLQARGRSGPAAVPATLTAQDPGVEGPAESAGPGGARPTAPASPAPSSPPRVPKGMVEARFTLTLLDQEVASAEKSRPGDPRLGEARNLRDEARRAFEEKRYPDAWTSALRARRRLGAAVEGVGGPPSPPEPAPPESPQTPGACPRCGRALRGGERYCRGCGASLAAHACPRCGIAVEANDEFCHACGAPVGG
jgi:hypothetical protein